MERCGRDSQAAATRAVIGANCEVTTRRGQRVRRGKGRGQNEAHGTIMTCGVSPSTSSMRTALQSH